MKNNLETIIAFSLEPKEEIIIVSQKGTGDRMMYVLGTNLTNGEGLTLACVFVWRYRDIGY